jgi:hypothetical protein
MYETSDGKLFEKEFDARRHESLYNDVKYYRYIYDCGEEKFSLIEKSPKNYKDTDYDNAAKAALAESEAIFIPDMDALNAICAYTPEYMPDFDNGSFVPHSGFYVWVESKDSFIPVSELMVNNEILAELGIGRTDLDELSFMKKAYNFKN